MIRNNIKKNMEKINIKENENHSPGSFGTVELINSLKIDEKNLENLSRKNNIKYLVVDDFSDINDEIKFMNLDYGIFTGGGMIKNTNECFNKGIITHIWDHYQCTGEWMLFKLLFWMEVSATFH